MALRNRSLLAPGLLMGAVLAVGYLTATDRLGFPVVILAGLMISSGCLDDELNRDCRLERSTAERLYGPERLSEDQRGLAAEMMRAYVRSLRFYRWFGLATAVAGAAGLAWRLN